MAPRVLGSVGYFWVVSEFAAVWEVQEWTQDTWSLVSIPNVKRWQIHGDDAEFGNQERMLEGFGLVVFSYRCASFVFGHVTIEGKRSPSYYKKEQVNFRLDGKLLWCEFENGSHTVNGFSRNGFVNCVSKKQVSNYKFVYSSHRIPFYGFRAHAGSEAKSASVSLAGP